MCVSAQSRSAPGTAHLTVRLSGMAGIGFGIFLSGSYGVGKSSTLDHLADCFEVASLPFSLFDVDWFHRSWPRASTDPRNVLTEAENIRAVWHNYSKVGPRTPIAAGVISNEEDRGRYEECFGLPLRIVHLTATPAVAEERLRGRHTAGQEAALAWHLNDYRRLARELGGLPHYDLVIDTDGRTPAEVAGAVFDRYAKELRNQARPAASRP